MYKYNMNIVWDDNKTESNIKKHQVTIGNAASCLLDPMALFDVDTIRIISARKPTARVQANYA